MTQTSPDLLCGTYAYAGYPRIRAASIPAPAWEYTLCRSVTGGIPGRPGIPEPPRTAAAGPPAATRDGDVDGIVAAASPAVEDPELGSPPVQPVSNTAATATPRATQLRRLTVPPDLARAVAALRFRPIPGICGTWPGGNA